MSNEEKEFRLIKLMLEELTSEAKSKSDLGVNLIDNLSAKFDDYLFQQAFDEKVSTPSKGLLSLVDWVRRIPQRLNYGPPYPASITRDFIEGLGNKGDITRAQIRLLNVYNMIRFDQTGSCLIIFPSNKDYSKAKVMIGMLLILTPLLGFVVWEVSSCILPGLPFGYAVGATLGLLWRGAYDLAWGRERLAKFLISRYPWFKITRHGIVA